MDNANIFAIAAVGAIVFFAGAKIVHGVKKVTKKVFHKGSPDGHREPPAA